jgi:hypothetical protein
VQRGWHPVSQNWKTRSRLATENRPPAVGGVPSSAGGEKSWAVDRREVIVNTLVL